MTHGLRSLTVAVLTYRRPLDLAEVLPLLERQARSVLDSVVAEVLVVDNSPDGDAREAVEHRAAAAARDAPAVRIAYVHQPDPGIAAARNMALDVSLTSDLLVFIDDDERPSELWLRHLLSTFDLYRPAAVVGPVRSEYEVVPEHWITAGRFFDRRRFATGTLRDVAATNNLLLDRRRVAQLGLAFETGLGMTGGDDTLFTRELVARGGALVWCDEALVVDRVPRARITRRWVVRRAFRSGNSWSIASIWLASSRAGRLLARVTASCAGVIRIAGGLAKLLVGSVSLSVGLRARGVRTAARGAGMLFGAWGISYAEYGRRA